MDIIRQAEEYARNMYPERDIFHGWEHIEEVRRNVRKLADFFPECDFRNLDLAAIFHDIDYSKPEDHVSNSIRIAEEFLVSMNYEIGDIQKVKSIMRAHGSPESCKKENMLEGQMLYDADKMTRITPQGFVTLTLYCVVYMKMKLPEAVQYARKRVRWLHKSLNIGYSENIISDDYAELKKILRKL
jgi:HD superfamily phosphodiesterase